MRNLSILCSLLLSLSFLVACGESKSPSINNPNKTPTPQSYVIPSPTITKLKFDQTSAPATQTIKVTYAGKTDYTFTDYAVEGTAFAVTSDAGCVISGTKLTVKPNGCTFTVKFTPVAKVNSVSSIKFGTNLVTLIGSGIGASAIKGTYDFGIQLQYPKEPSSDNSDISHTITIPTPKSPATISVLSDGVGIDNALNIWAKPIMPPPVATGACFDNVPSSINGVYTTDSTTIEPNCWFDVDIDSSNTNSFNTKSSGIIEVKNNGTVEEYIWSYKILKGIQTVAIAGSDKDISPNPQPVGYKHTHFQNETNLTFEDTKQGATATLPYSVIIDYDEDSGKLFTSSNDITFSAGFFTNFKINKSWTTCNIKEIEGSAQMFTAPTNSYCVIAIDFIPTVAGDITATLTAHETQTMLIDSPYPGDSRKKGDIMEFTGIAHVKGKGI